MVEIESNQIVLQKQLARMENDRKLQKPKYRFGLGGGSAGAGNQVVSRGNSDGGCRLSGHEGVGK